MCSIENCQNKASTCGYCHKHYKRLQVHGDALFTMQCDLKGKTCEHPECTAPARKVYLCNTHYTLKWRTDNPEKAKLNDRQQWYRRGLRRRNAKGKHTRKEWEELLQRHEYKCFYCPEKATTRDHIIPLAKGGTDDISNIIPACKSCNCKKHTRTIGEFLFIQHNERNHDVTPLRMSEQGIHIGDRYANE